MPVAKVPTGDHRVDRFQDQVAHEMSKPLVIERRTALPGADASWLGKFLRVRAGNGEAEKVYICLMDSNNAFSWAQVATTT